MHKIIVQPLYVLITQAARFDHFLITDEIPNLVVGLGTHFQMDELHLTVGADAREALRA